MTTPDTQCPAHACKSHSGLPPCNAECELEQSPGDPTAESTWPTPSRLADLRLLAADAAPGVLVSNVIAIADAVIDAAAPVITELHREIGRLNRQLDELRHARRGLPRIVLILPGPLFPGVAVVAIRDERHDAPWSCSNGATIRDHQIPANAIELGAIPRRHTPGGVS